MRQIALYLVLAASLMGSTLSFTVTSNDTLTPRFYWSGDCTITAYVDTVSYGTFVNNQEFTEAWANANGRTPLIVTTGQAVEYAISDDSTILYIILDGDSVSGNMTQYATFANLERLDISGNGTWTGDLSVLNNSTGLTFLNTQNTLGLSASSGAFESNTAIVNLLGDNGNMSQASIDNILQGLLAGQQANPRTLVAVTLEGNAAPSSTGEAAAASLILAGWTVLTETASGGDPANTTNGLIHALR